MAATASVRLSHYLPDSEYVTPSLAAITRSRESSAEFEREARLAMAVKLSEMKRLSSGQAALLAGIDRTTFLMQLSEQGVAMIDPPIEELADDVRHPGVKVAW